MALILVVDDEPSVIQVCRFGLEKAGHQVMTAATGSEASRLAAQIERIDLLIVDHSMDHGRGPGIAASLLLIHPEMKVILMSGWSADQLQDKGGLVPGALFLSKPFNLAKLTGAVAAQLAQRANN